MQTTKELRSKIGMGFFEQLYGGMKFMPCLIELLKNSLVDWGASHVYITMTDTTFTIRDDGVGMNRANQAAFISLNESTAKALRDASGKFGSGTKGFLYSFSTGCKVLTANAGKVYNFEVLTKDVEKLLLSQGKIKATEEKQDNSNWVFDHKSGTQITYELRRDANIISEKRLRTELAKRLPRHMGRKVTLGGQPLPDKPSKIPPFILSEDDPYLGLVYIELDPSSGYSDQLLFSGGIIGEVTMPSFIEALGDKRIFVPELLSLGMVTGTVSASYLKEFANPDRASFQPTLADDPRTTRLLELLSQQVPAIMQQLGLKDPRAKGLGNLNEVIEDIIAKAGQQYDPVKAKKTGVEETTAPPPIRGGHGNHRPIKIELERNEFEIGETITATVTLSESIKSSRGVSEENVSWDASGSLTRESRKKLVGETIQLTASKIGWGYISAALAQGTALETSISYLVLEKGERKLRLNPQIVRAEEGKAITIMAVNGDKISGKPKWSVHGGRTEAFFEASELRARFMSNNHGDYEIILKDSADHGNQGTCKIEVFDSKKRLQIRNQLFEVYGTEFGTTRGPVAIEKQGSGNLHIMHLNTTHPATLAAESQGSLSQFMRDAIADEFARFWVFDISPDDYEEFGREGLAKTISAMAWEISSELTAPITKKISKIKAIG